MCSFRPRCYIPPLLIHETIGAVDAKEAALVALDRAREGFGHDNITNLGLEELEHEESSDSWFITVGFSRPWDFEQDPLSGFAPRKAPRKTTRLCISLRPANFSRLRIESLRTNDGDDASEDAGS